MVHSKQLCLKNLCGGSYHPPSPFVQERLKFLSILLLSHETAPGPVGTILRFCCPYLSVTYYNDPTMVIRYYLPQKTPRTEHQARLSSSQGARTLPYVVLLHQLHQGKSMQTQIWREHIPLLFHVVLVETVEKYQHP